MSFDDPESLSFAFSRAADAGDETAVPGLMTGAHASDVAAALTLLDESAREFVIAAAGDSFPPRSLPYFDGDVLSGVAEALGPERFSACVSALEAGEAVSVLEELSEEEREETLARLRRTRFLQQVRQGLAYPEDSVGRLMNLDVVHIPEYWTAGQATDYMRKSLTRSDYRFHSVYLTDPTMRPVGGVSPAQLLCAPRETPLKSLLRDETPHKLDPNADQEEAAHLFRRYGLISAPVVDERGALIGEVAIDRVLDVIDEEAQEDILRLGGVNAGDVHAGVAAAVRRRFPWLLLNLITASISSTVIALFEGTIERFTVLAVLLPVVAGLTGNAATQALTVAVRAISMQELTPANAWRTLRKEILAGIVNGLGLAAFAGLLVAFRYSDPLLGVVFGTAVAACIAVAGAAGTLVPIVLTRLGADPAAASAVFVTALTDMAAFATLLGVASRMLLP